MNALTRSRQDSSKAPAGRGSSQRLAQKTRTPAGREATLETRPEASPRGRLPVGRRRTVHSIARIPFGRPSCRRHSVRLRYALSDRRWPGCGIRGGGLVHGRCCSLRSARWFCDRFCRQADRLCGTAPGIAIGIRVGQSLDPLGGLPTVVCGLGLVAARALRSGVFGTWFRQSGSPGRCCESPRPRADSCGNNGGQTMHHWA